MPTHTKSKSSDAAASKKKTGPSSAAGGGRSAVTGRPLGKAGVRALTKNAECVEEYIDLCERAERVGQNGSDVTDALESASLILARVTRTVGGGRIVVQLLDGTENVSVPIGGSVKLKGRAATKTDRTNCMCQGDLVVVRGGIAAGKLSPAAAAHVGTIFADCGVVAPRGFFGAAASADDDDAFEFDRSDQLAAESAEVAKVRADAARAAALRSGTAVAEDDTSALDIDAI